MCSWTFITVNQQAELLRFEYSEKINQEMWQKYLFTTALSGITSLMESPIGPIMALENGRNTVTSLLGEITAIMNKMNSAY